MKDLKYVQSVWPSSNGEAGRSEVDMEILRTYCVQYADRRDADADAGIGLQRSASTPYLCRIFNKKPRP